MCFASGKGIRKARQRIENGKKRVIRYFVAGCIRFDAFQVQNVQLTRLYRMRNGIISISNILSSVEHTGKRHQANNCASRFAFYSIKRERYVKGRERERERKRAPARKR